MSSARDVTVRKSALPEGAATEATAATLGTQATLATRASEATVSTLSTEATAAAIEALATLIEAKIVPDGLSNAIRVIDYGHHEIHSGRMYRVQANADPIAEIIIAFKVGDQAREPHMVWEFITESMSHVILYEAPTWTTNTGTRRTCKQSNRNSGNTSILEGDGNGAGGFTAGEVVIDPTGLAGGTAISDKRTFTDNRQGGGQGSRRHEVILKTDTLYAFVLTSDDGSKGMQLRLEWYEHTAGSYT